MTLKTWQCDKDDGGGYMAIFEEYPSLSAWGETEDNAIDELRMVHEHVANMGDQEK